MKSALILEDTPKGLSMKLIWQSNGYQDHVTDSIAMNVMGNITLLIKELQDKKVLRIAPESPEEPSGNPLRP